MSSDCLVALFFTNHLHSFAEMVKSDEHMGRVKQRLVNEAASKKAAQEARRQRDLKKFGKQVQVEKRQERDKAKRETLERINTLKRSKSCHALVHDYLKLIPLSERANAPLTNDTEADLFDVALEDAETTAKNDRAARKASALAKPNAKRQKRDEKYGFGGKKRHAKSNDAISSADTRSYSSKKMKAGAKASAKRPGKDRRAKGRA